VSGGDPLEPARVAVALVGGKEAFAAQAQVPAPLGRLDLRLERRRPAVARGRLGGALVVEGDEEGSRVKRGGAARQEAPVGNSPGSTMCALRAALTDPR
jgi:hypothetical protein